MNTQTHRSRLDNCQFVIPTGNSNVGRVKISQQNLVVLASQQVIDRIYLNKFFFYKLFILSSTLDVNGRSLYNWNMDNIIKTSYSRNPKEK